MKRIYAEIGFGNGTFLSTEVEEGNHEYRIQGFILPEMIKGVYLRFWIFKRVLIISTNNGFEINTKDRNKLKILFGISGDGLSCKNEDEFMGKKEKEKLNMEYLKTITDEDIFENPKFEKPDVFEKRTTVKAVVINDEGKFGFVTTFVNGFYLLAGGGAEGGNLEEEIKRECDEEINFEIEVLREVGRIHEYRNRNAKEYETVCFIARTMKELPEDTRTEDEKKKDLHVVWIGKNEAINILKEQVEKVKRGEVEFYNTAFNIVRDELFFNEYLGDMIKQ